MLPLLTCSSKALLIASQTMEYRPILEASFGIAFLGVPHGGSELANPLARIASIVNAVEILGIPKPFRADLIKSLKANNKELMELSESFKEIGSRLKIISFYELEYIAGRRV
jgi:hypothetical protein